MKRRAWKGWTVGAFLLLLSLPLGSPSAWGQRPQTLTLGPGTDPVTLFAERIEHLAGEHLLIASGNVEAQQGEVRLEADRLEINTETGVGVAVGKVVFHDGIDRILGERMEFNFRSGTGVVFKGDAFAQPHFFVRGDRMERLGEKVYRVQQGLFTTCDQPDPHWSVTFGRMTATLDDWLYGTNATFWAWKIPLIPWIPYFATGLRKDRHTGFLSPTFGQSSTKGFEMSLPFFWAISESQDLTVAPRYFEKRGVGLGAEYRFARSERSRGEVAGFFIHDTETRDDRYVLGLRHEERFTDQLTLKADLGYVSDDQYFPDYGDTLDQRSRQRVESNLSVTQRWPTWNLVGNLFYYQDLTTPVRVELQKLPEIRLTGIRQPLPFATSLLGESSLFLEFEGSFVNFVREVGTQGPRLDLNPKISFPVSAAGYVTFVPFVGVRETLYDRRVVGTVVEQGFLVDETEQGTRARTLLQTGVSAESRLTRVFSFGRWGLDRIQHVIEPRAAYNLVSNGGREAPQFDAVDPVQAASNVAYSVTNRLNARAPAADDGTPGPRWELARWVLSQSYDFIAPRVLDPDNPERLVKHPFSSVTSDLLIQPLPPGQVPVPLQFRTTAAVDVYGQGLTSLTTDLAVMLGGWRATLGTSHGQDAKLQFVRGEVSGQLSRHWAARASVQYDAISHTNVENRFEVDYRQQCWAISLGLINRVDEDEVRLTVNLLELGSVGFGTLTQGGP